MEAYQQRKADYVKQQVALGYPVRRAAQWHKNSIAIALGKNLEVSKAILADYSCDWSLHPLCCNRTDLAHKPTLGKSGM